MIVYKDLMVIPTAVLVGSLELLSCVGLSVGLIAGEVFDGCSSRIAL
ncbi:MAG: hypothetical protein L7S59_07065 [Pseudomonadales bacterium]|nr:hypothetical protein [Pseudomonadales bacterium]